MGFHRVDGVADDVKKHLHQLIAITTNTGKHRLQIEVDLHAGVAKIECTELYRVGHYGIQVKKGAFGRHLPGKAEQVSYQRLRPARLIANLSGNAASLFWKRSVVREQI